MWRSRSSREAHNATESVSASGRLATALITTTAPSQTQRPDQPRIDFDEIARVLGGELAHPPSASVFGARLERKLLRGGNWRQAWHLRRERPRCFVSLSEPIGMPLSFMGARQVPHLLIAHNLTTERRRAFQRRTRYLERFDRIIVLSRGQERFLREETAVRPERIHFVYDKVDHRFFAPSVDVPKTGYVLAVGSEQRDYATLVAASSALGAPTVIVASSLWNKPHEIADRELPDCVTVRRDLSYRELRELYDGAALVVVPVRAGIEYAAGVNAVMEAMAMRRPLIVSRTPGLVDYVDHGVTGHIVAPEDTRALADAMRLLLSDRAEAGRLAGNARAVIEGGRNLDTYVQAVAGAACAIAADHRGG